MTKRVVTWLAVLGTAGAHAPAQSGFESRLLARVPDGIEAVITVSGGAQQRGTPAGRSLAAFARDAGFLDRTREAWAELARVTQLTPEDAFDELLGRRVTLVLRGVGSGSVADWALISRITPDAEARLRHGLRPATRAVESGLPVLSIEHGRYELTVVRRGADGAESSTILLAPAEDAGLFDALLPIVADLPEAPEPRGDARMLLRAAPRNELEQPLVIALDMDQDRGRARTWRVRFRLTGVPVADHPRPWSSACLALLERDAVVATVGVLRPSPLADAAARLGFNLPEFLGPRAHESFGDRAALVVCQPATPPAPGAERALLAAEGRPKATPPEPCCTVSVALETPDLARAIPMGDSLGASVISLLDGGRIADDNAGGMQIYSALPDDFIRRLPITGDAALRVQPLLGENPSVSWGFSRASGARRTAPSAGWWVLTLAGEDSAPDGTASVRGALAHESDSGLKPRLSVGVARPGRLVRLADRLDPAFLAPLGALRWIEALRWDCWVGAGGAVEGEISVRMATPPE